MLSPPFTPPAHTPYTLPKLKPISALPLQNHTFSQTFIAQISRVLNQPVLSLTILTRHPLYHVLCVQISPAQACLLRLFTHHATPAHAMAAVMESLVQDGEDLLLTLPYDMIRRHAMSVTPLLNTAQPHRLFLLGDLSTSVYPIPRNNASCHPYHGVPSNAIHLTHPALLWTSPISAYLLRPDHRRQTGNALNIQLLGILVKALYSILTCYLPPATPSKGKIQRCPPNVLSLNKSAANISSPTTIADPDITARRQMTATLAQLEAAAAVPHER